MTSQVDVLIRASAGTGKTFQLSNRFLSLLHSGVPPDEILATTFTRKAAGEILDRVIVRLAEAASDGTRCVELAEQLAIASLGRDKCHAMLRSLINHLHRLRICTLDAFFAQLAGSFSLDLGLPSGWHIVEPLLDQYLRSAAIEATLRDNSLKEVSRLISLMTKGDAQRSVRELVNSTVNDLYTLYMETDHEAWQRVPRPRKMAQEQVARAIDVLENVELPTHKKVKDAHLKSVEFARQGDWESFVTKGIPAKLIEGVTVYYNKELGDEAIDAYNVVVNHARAFLLNELAHQTEATYQLLGKFHDQYSILKKQSRGLRFEDITQCLARQQTLHDVTRQHFRLDAMLSHLLLDEFQDTSLSQWQVLQPFSKSVIGKGSERTGADDEPEHSFFCVGDTKQAIYGWRGGRSEIFDAIESQFPSVKRQTLAKSYRSSQPIIDTVNRVFTRMTSHSNLEDCRDSAHRWCNCFPEHETAKTDLRGYSELRTAPLAEQGQKQLDVTIDFAADRIQELVEQSPAASIGVLVRTNATVAKVIYQLRARGVPASEEGGNPLTDSSAVQLVLSLFRLADHPGDDVARFHLSESPLAQACQLNRRDEPAAGRLLARRLRHQLISAGYGATVNEWGTFLLPYCDRRDRNRLAQLVDLAYRYEQVSSLRATDFIKYVEGMRVADPTTAEVRVMTIHQAKGLQFDIVVLPELEFRLVGQPDNCVVGQPSPTEPIDRVCRYRNVHIQGMLPQELRQLFEETKDQAVREILCVMYVALTRPIHALHMIIAPSAKSEKKLPKTVAGLLRAALTDGACTRPEEVFFRTGECDWYQGDETPIGSDAEDADVGTSVASPTELPAAANMKVRLATPLPGSQPRHQAPSRLEGGTCVSVDRVLDLSDSVAKRRGTLVHAWFERVGWLDDASPRESLLREIAAKHDLAGMDLEQTLQQFLASLEVPEIRAILCREYYQTPRGSGIFGELPNELSEQVLRVELHRERRFVVRDEQQIMSGAIDRLVLLFDGSRLVAADVIDFKTDRINLSDSSRLNERITYYRPQLDAYRLAVSTMFRLPVDRIGTRLIFVTCGVVSDV